MSKLDVLLISAALALAGAAITTADAGAWRAANARSGASLEPIRVTDRPQVRKSTVTKKSSDLPGHRGPRAKASKDVVKLVCEGGQIKTSSAGVRGCACGLNVRRVLVKKNHFRCERADRPQVRKSSVTKKSSDLPGHRGPRAKSSAAVDKQPGSSGRPIPKQTGPGKPVKECGDMISATRLAAVTRKGGRLTAQAGWSIAVRKHYPKGWSNWNNAKDRKTNCQFAGTWNCTASARPCGP